MKPQKFFIFVSSVFQSGFLARRALFRIEIEKEKATLCHFFLCSQSFSKFSLLFSLSSEVKERGGESTKVWLLFRRPKGPSAPVFESLLFLESCWMLFGKTRERIERSLGCKKKGGKERELASILSLPLLLLLLLRIKRFFRLLKGKTFL